MTNEEYIAELEKAIENLGWLFKDSLEVIADLQTLILTSDDEELKDDAGRLLMRAIFPIRHKFEVYFSDESEYVKRMRAKDNDGSS